MKRMHEPHKELTRSRSNGIIWRGNRRKMHSKVIMMELFFYLDRRVSCIGSIITHVEKH